MLVQNASQLFCPQSTCAPVQTSPYGPQLMLQEPFDAQSSTRLRHAPGCWQFTSHP